MHISFDEMPNDARLWIYQSDRKLTEEEESLIRDNTASFLEQWAAHGSGLNSSYQILYNQFLIIAVDEAVVSASGCSIDKQVQFIQALGSSLSINFLDRTKVAFLKERQEMPASDSILISSLNEIKDKVAAGAVKANTLTFNNLVSSKAELKERWIIPAGESWLKRYF